MHIRLQVFVFVLSSGLTIHLNKVINESFQSHFSDNALMILNLFLPKFVHLYGQQFGGVLEKKIFYFLVLGKKCKKQRFGR